MSCFEVWSTRLLSTWFVFAQQNILCKNFQTLRIISGGKCAVSEREIYLQVKKNEIWAERADQKHINNLALAWQFALTAVKLQMFGGKTRHVSHPIRTWFFVSCPRSDATDGISYVTLHFRDRRAQLRLLTEIVSPKLWFLCVNRSPIRYGFRAGARAIRYSVNIT